MSDPPERPATNGTYAAARAALLGLAHPAGLAEGTVHSDLASWLVAKEMSGAEAEAGTDGKIDAAERACQKLSQVLSRSLSPAGSQVLLSRALSLTGAEFPFLEGVRARRGPGACFEGLHECNRDLDTDDTTTALLAVLGALLDLLVRYIGEALTLRLVWEAWPDLPLLALSEPRNSDHQEPAPP